jgi:hypothetical protein
MNENNKTVWMNFSNEKSDNCIEIQQSPENVVIISVILVNAIVMVASAMNLSYLEEWGWFLIVVGGIVLIQMTVRLYLRIFKSPQSMVLDNNTLTVSMFFGEKISLNVSEVESMTYDGLLSLFVQSGGWLTCPQRNLKLFVGKPFFNNFDVFAIALRQRNPTCVIDYRLVEWHGRKSLSW